MHGVMAFKSSNNESENERTMEYNLFSHSDKVIRAKAAREKCLRNSRWLWSTLIYLKKIQKKYNSYLQANDPDVFQWVRSFSGIKSDGEWYSEVLLGCHYQSCMGSDSATRISCCLWNCENRSLFE